MERLIRHLHIFAICMITPSIKPKLSISNFVLTFKAVRQIWNERLALRLDHAFPIELDFTLGVLGWLTYTTELCSFCIAMWI